MAIPFLVAAIVGGGAFAASTAVTAGFAGLVGAAFWGKVATSFLLGSVIGALGYLSRPRNSGDNKAPSDVISNVVSSVGPARYVYGEARTGGQVAFAGESDNGKDYWTVIALSEGACERITGLYLAGDKQEIARTSEGVITITSGQYAGHVTIWEEFAADGNVNTPGQTALRGAQEEWTNRHYGGLSFIIARLTQGDGNEPFDSPPSISVVMKGRKLLTPDLPNYDNLGAADQPQPVAAWTENAAAIAWDFLIQRRGIPVAELDKASFRAGIAYAGQRVAVSRPDSNYDTWPADEIRFGAGGVIFSDDDPTNVQTNLELAFQGSITEFNGLFYLEVGRPETPSVSITEADIKEMTAMQNMPDVSDRTNIVSGSLSQSKQHDFGEYAIPAVTDEFQLARDGERLEKDLGRATLVNSPSQGDRNLRMALARSRAVLQCNLTLVPKREWQLLRPTTKVNLTYSPVGFENQPFRVLGTTIEDDGRVNVALEEYDRDALVDRPGLGEVQGRKLRIPRVNTQPEAIAAADITASIAPRVNPDGSYKWLAVVQVPDSNLGFTARLTIGDITLEKQTRGSTIEFDEGVPQGSAEFTVWRVSRSGLAGPTTSVEREPSYEAVSLPTPKFLEWTRTGGVLRVQLSDPVQRGVQGCEFRYTTAELGTTTVLPAINAAGWAAALRFDSQRVLLQPGQNAIFNCAYTEGGRYRIFARYCDSVGRLGPVSEMGLIDLSPPATNLRSIDGAPAWAGTKKNLYDFPAGTFGSEQPLIPDRNDAPSALTRGEFEVVPESTTDAVTKWQYRFRTDGGTYGNWIDVTAASRSVIISGLTNGQRYDVQFRAVRSDSGNSSANTLQARPVAAATAPPAPAVTLRKANPTSLDLRSVVSGAVSTNAPIQKHQYRIATSSGGVSSASWTDIASSASKDVSFSITGLPQNATRYIQTRAVNSVGGGSASSTLTAKTAGNGGRGTKFGSWANAAPSDTSTIFRQVADVDDAADGLFRLQTPWKSGGPTAHWYGYYQWTDGNTRHQIRLATYGIRNHRSRTRTSQQADWGAWSAWGSPDSYRAADLNEFTSGVAPGIFSPTGQPGFAESSNGFNPRLAAWVNASIWFIYNETTGTGANAVTYQVAVKFYRDGGWNQAYRWRRKTEYPSPTPPASNDPIYGTWTKDTRAESEIFRQVANIDDTTDGGFRRDDPWGRIDWWDQYYQWTDGNTRYQLWTYTADLRRWRSRTRANANAAWGAWSTWTSIPKSGTNTYRTTNLTPYIASGAGRLFIPNATTNAPPVVIYPGTDWTTYYDSANSVQVAEKLYRRGSVSRAERWTRTITFPNPTPGTGGTAAAPNKSTSAAVEE